MVTFRANLMFVGKVLNYGHHKTYSEVTIGGLLPRKEWI